MGQQLDLTCTGPHHEGDEATTRGAKRASVRKRRILRHRRCVAVQVDPFESNQFFHLMGSKV
jgi:hypothetical protein